MPLPEMLRRGLPGLSLALAACGAALAGPPAPPPSSVVVATDTVPEPAPQPALSIEKPSLDLGVVQEGEEVVATFVLRNTGPGELRILHAVPG